MSTYTYTDYEYAQQAKQPAWFGTFAINLAATSGSSPFNQWYGFQSRKDAVAVLSDDRSQQFIDNYEIFDGEIYSREFTQWDEETEETTLLEGAVPADLNDIVRIQSPF